jgi:hypothetical protein
MENNSRDRQLAQFLLRVLIGIVILLLVIWLLASL